MREDGERRSGRDRPRPGARFAGPPRPDLDPGEKDIAGCGLVGIISRKRRRFDGSVPTRAIANLRFRGNGLGGGLAGYGIYPDMADRYALHVLLEDRSRQRLLGELLDRFVRIHDGGEIPTRPVPSITDPPAFRRYFVTPRPGAGSEDDAIVDLVMRIHRDIPGACVVSSGKDMGAFKGVGFPEEIADFFRLETYRGHLWIAHNRFPTNSQAWWGGAHPFTILDWAIVHNGEISSYDTNRRYLRMHGYDCTLGTDTEVVSYLLDLLVRRHGLPMELACRGVLAAPFWKDIDALPPEERELYRTLRFVYGEALLNGPFAILIAHGGGLVGLNDRIKLRPLIAAESGDLAVIASEEASIRAVLPRCDRIFVPAAGEPVILDLEPRAAGEAGDATGDFAPDRPGLRPAGSAR